MKTKLTLTIAGKENELASDCLMNWDEVQCTCKRADFSGVVRSFSSKFEFTNAAYDMLMSAYLNDGVRADAVVAIYVLNNDWSWSKEFEAPLNFSTASWDGYVFSVNCIDNGLAALIKARKSTKYEFTVGDDIEAYGTLNYDRMIMQNSCVHEIMGDDNGSDGSVLLSGASSLSRLPTYSLTSETFENSPILFGDQTDEKGSAFITAVRPLSNLKIRLEIWTNKPGVGLVYAKSVGIYLKKFKGADDSMEDVAEVFSYAAERIDLGYGSSYHGISGREYFGEFASLEDLKRTYPNPPQDVWAKVGGAAYITPVSNNPELVQWELGELEAVGIRDHGIAVCNSRKYIMEFDLQDIPTGQKFALFYTADIVGFLGASVSGPHFPLFSKISVHWESRAKTVGITAIKPVTLMSRLIDKMSDGRFNVIPHLSDFDPRLAKTYLLAAESVRDVPGAKIYSSFNDFCDWMETVFGYVYTLGEAVLARYDGIMKFNSILDDFSFMNGSVVEGVIPDHRFIVGPFFIRKYGSFFVWDIVTGNMYTLWKDSDKYNDENGKGRKDVMFDDGRKYYVIDDDGNMVEYAGDAKTASLITQPIYFMHRSELFQDIDQGIVFTDAVEAQSKVNSSILYSTVEVGYEKQDYETECGRDEWNFMNYYNTGIDVTEKKLTLQSKYRADCYGLEFLAQERANDSTDNKSDDTVFFVLCEEVEKAETDTAPSVKEDAEDDVVITTKVLSIDRSAKISGALSDTVFNGEFSPYYCVKANEGYISAMAPNVTLQFASSDGNSDIVIDGVKTTADIALGERLFSEMELDFTATDLERTIDYSKLVKVVKNGLVYSGFFKQTESCYARPSEVDYTLIVKRIEPI